MNDSLLKSARDLLGELGGEDMPLSMRDRIELWFMAYEENLPWDTSE